MSADNLTEPDTSTALVGVRRCGCITAALVEGYADKDEVREFYVTMADTDREVRRMGCDEAKASPHFLGCPHEGAEVAS
jgi:hypothetical protein